MTVVGKMSSFFAENSILAEGGANLRDKRNGEGMFTLLVTFPLNSPLACNLFAEFPYSSICNIFFLFSCLLSLNITVCAFLLAPNI